MKCEYCKKELNYDEIGVSWKNRVKVCASEWHREKVCKTTKVCEK